MPEPAGGKDHCPRVRYRGELQAPPGYGTLVTAAVSVSGPVAIWSSADSDAGLHARYEQRPGGASFPRTASVTRPAVALAAYEGSGTVPARVARVRALPVTFPHVDLLADGTFLVAGGRCAWTPAGGPVPGVPARPARRRRAR